MGAFGTSDKKRRALGQHFLKDQTVIQTIVDAALKNAQETHSKKILEIGPGRGALTEALIAGLGNDQSLMLCEKDWELAYMWREKKHPSIFVHEADFMDLKIEQWLTDNLTVVSNLPYSVGTAIFTRLAKYPKQISSMTLMFQAEVVQRLRAAQGTKSWGSLSIWTQNDWEVEKLISAPPEAFVPPPAVDSEVAVFKPRIKPLIDTSANPEAWNALLKTAFAHRRKMLRSGLPKSGVYRKAFEIASLDGTKRAEALEWPEWQNFYLALLQALQDK